MRTFVKSVTIALRGIRIAFREERNMRIHGWFAIAALLISVTVGLSAIEFSLIIISCAMVLCSELINTVFERFLDSMKPRFSPQHAAMKDMLAASVLIASAAALCVGALIIIPKIVSWLLL